MFYINSVDRSLPKHPRQKLAQAIAIAAIEYNTVPVLSIESLVVIAVLLMLLISWSKSKPITNLIAYL